MALLALLAVLACLAAPAAAQASAQAKAAAKPAPQVGAAAVKKPDVDTRFNHIITPEESKNATVLFSLPPQTPRTYFAKFSTQDAQKNPRQMKPAENSTQISRRRVMRGDSTTSSAGAAAAAVTQALAPNVTAGGDRRVLQQVADRVSCRVTFYQSSGGIPWLILDFRLRLRTTSTYNVFEATSSSSSDVIIQWWGTHTFLATCLTRIPCQLCMHEHLA